MTRHLCAARVQAEGLHLLLVVVLEHIMNPLLKVIEYRECQALFKIVSYNRSNKLSWSTQTKMMSTSRNLVPQLWKISVLIR